MPGDWYKDWQAAFTGRIAPAETLGSWLRAQRLAHGWTMSEMADQIHRAARAIDNTKVASVATLTSYVNQWEHDRQYVPERYRHYYCAVLDILPGKFGPGRALAAIPDSRPVSMEPPKAGLGPSPDGVRCPLCGGSGKAPLRGPNAAGGPDAAGGPGVRPGTDLDPKFWTVAEAAGLMRVSKMTVYRMVHSRELESRRVGRGFRIPEQAVRAYLSGGTHEPIRLTERKETEG